MIRAVFMGSPSFAVPSLHALHRVAEIPLVVTQPDKPSGRGRALTPPPVKEAALALGLPVYQPRSAKTEDFLGAMQQANADVAVVVAYGKILPPPVLAAFPKGCLNVHASLLPSYRGAAPVQWAVIDGQTTTGVALMQLEAGLDTGPVFCTRTVEIGDRETGGELMARLAEVGADVLGEALPAISRGELVARPQDHAQATHASLLSKAHGGVDFRRSARDVASLIRGVDPWPGAVAIHRGAPLKLFGAHVDGVVASPGDAAPGTIVAIEADGARVACGQGCVVITELQLAGRRRTRPSELAAGRSVAVGDLMEMPEDAVLRA